MLEYQAFLYSYTLFLQIIIEERICLFVCWFFLLSLSPNFGFGGCGFLIFLCDLIILCLVRPWGFGFGFGFLVSFVFTCGLVPSPC